MLQTASSISEKFFNMAWLCEISNIYVFTYLPEWVLLSALMAKKEKIPASPCCLIHAKEKGPKKERKK